MIDGNGEVAGRAKGTTVLHRESEDREEKERSGVGK